MRKISYVFLIIFSFWIMNCSAADGTKKQEIKIEKLGDSVTLGVLMTELNDKDKEKLKADHGAKVVDVIEGSAAEKAGLKAKDVIVSFEGEKIETAKQLDKIVEDLDEGKQVKFKALRDGKEMSFSATLKEMDEKGYTYAFSDDEDGGNFSWHFKDGDDEDMSWFSDDDFNKEVIVNGAHPGLVNVFEGESNKGGFLGVEGHNISDQMLEYFQVKNGVLVEKVLKDTPAEKAGLQAGDVITFIEGRKIEDYNDLIRTLNYFNPNEKVEIQFVRKGSEKNVDVTLAEKKKGNAIFFNKNGDNTVIEDGDAVPHIRMKKLFKDGKDMDNIVKHVFYII
jgi:C-terminal processing protease CtpA/Prc